MEAVGVEVVGAEKERRATTSTRLNAHLWKQQSFLFSSSVLNDNRRTRQDKDKDKDKDKAERTRQGSKLGNKFQSHSPSGDDVRLKSSRNLASAPPVVLVARATTLVAVSSPASAPW